ncbi:hypothetical protein [Kutzneria kofuensis]|uniref:hypothetical protein n=1 Tax=Kutzneria kofuensis TaxID=103725 RepID=UPI0031E83986
MVKVRDIAFVAAPALLGGYGVVRLLSGHGPGIGWDGGAPAVPGRARAVRAGDADARRPARPGRWSPRSGCSG